MPSLLPGASQSDPGSYLHPATRKTYLILEYVFFSDDHRLPLLGKRLQMLLCKAGRKRGPQVSLLEARKSFHLQFCHSLPEQGKFSSSSIKIEESRLDLFYFYFYFYFYLFFDFLFLEQLGLGLISHTVTT